jgi:hypothetical protein
MFGKERITSQPVSDYSEIEKCFKAIMLRPDAIKRQEEIFKSFKDVTEEAKRLGIDNIFLMGSLSSPVLRDYRPHDDVDIFVPDKNQCLSLIQNLQHKGYVNHRPYVLRGGSLYYLTHPTNGIPVEIRYARPIGDFEEGTAWGYITPPWSHLVMPRSLVIPPSALSREDEKRSWNGIETRYVYDEYNWLIKSKSPYPKDQIDAVRLFSQGLREERINRILEEIAILKGNLMLPPALIKLVRSFEFWNLPSEDYKILHGLCN